MVLQGLSRQYSLWKIKSIERKFYNSNSEQEEDNLMADYYFHKFKINFHRMWKEIGPDHPLEEDVYFKKAYGCMKVLERLGRKDLLEKLGFYSLGNPFALYDAKDEPQVIFMQECL